MIMDTHGIEQQPEHLTTTTTSFNHEFNHNQQHNITIRQFEQNSQNTHFYVT